MADRALHYLVCWNPDYVARAVEDHLKIIQQVSYGSDDDGTAWWGKFRVPVDENGVPGEEYEPYGESKAGEEAVREVAEFKQRIRDGEEVRLYIHNPNPPMTECHVGHMVDVHYGESASLPDDDQGRPACARIPAYYFHHKEENACSFCRERKPECRLRHECGYWFKLSDIKPNPQGEYYRDLLDAKTGKKLDFAVTLLYPLLLQERPPERRLFDPKRKFRLPVEDGRVPWKGSFPVIEEAARIREQAINQFVRNTFLTGGELDKAEFFLNRHLLEDAALYLSHQYELILDEYEKNNGDLERPHSNWKFVQMLVDKGRIDREKFKVLGAANDVRNHVFHGDDPPNERKLLGLLQDFRRFEK